MRNRRRPMPVGRWLVRRRWSVWLRGGLIAAVVAGLLIARGMGPEGERRRWDRRPLKVVDVLDARTLRVQREDGERTRVRLLGVAIEEGWSQRCRRAVREAADDETVTLSFDADRRPDASERLSAYVYLDGGRMLNEWLIEQGLARADPAVPHELSEWFARLERQARGRARGMWADSEADQ